MQRRPKLLTSAAMLAVSALAFLSACTVVVEEPRPLPPPPGPGFCSREYVPVCARRFDRLRTFPNACVAEREGFRVVSFSSCRDDRPQFCTREYAPVCATRRGALRTFPNACKARAADWRIVRNRPC